MSFTRETKTAALLALALCVVGLAIFGCGSRQRAGVGPEPSPEIVEGGAVFRYFNSDAKKVLLVGDFNNWSPTADPMKDLNGDGHWS
ncbi:MAG: hypothetical protein KAT30_15205, partial [Candidatus Krumholzibacteria bacterium]|nr:hypothetical protein [Candidatus Krumholzibacteria bacterium]